MAGAVIEKDKHATIQHTGFLFSSYKLKFLIYNLCVTVCKFKVYNILIQYVYVL